MACRGFTAPRHPKSVTYVLNLFCILCPEPAPDGFAVANNSLALLVRVQKVRTNRIFPAQLVQTRLV